MDWDPHIQRLGIDHPLRNGLRRWNMLYGKDRLIRNYPDLPYSFCTHDKTAIIIVQAHTKARIKRILIRSTSINSKKELLKG